MNADGTFSYTPDLNYFGADSFSYNLSDGSLDSNLATVSLTVTPVNDAPVAADAQATTAEDTPLVIALGAYAITNDLAGVVGQPSQMASSFISDVDSTNITTQIVAGPAHGVLVTNADGTYSYTPDANYNGADSFTYKANDGQLDSNVATVTLGITPVNDAPTLGDLNLAAVEDTALPMNLLAAASDIDSTTLTAAIVAGPLHGAVVFNQDGTFTYTAAANYNGADSFTYKVNDGHLASDKRGFQHRHRHPRDRLGERWHRKAPMRPLPRRKTRRMCSRLPTSASRMRTMRALRQVQTTSPLWPSRLCRKPER